MQPELYLITPPDAGARFAATLALALAAAPVAAVLIQRGPRELAPYREAARALIPVAQAAGAAALVDGDPGLAEELAADGVQVAGGLGELKSAIALLKPGRIVGAGAVHTRHDAMLAGESGADYLFFGSLGPTPSGPDLAAMARWWVETFAVPAVWFPGDDGPGPGAPNAEFLALRNSVWNAPRGPGGALGAFARKTQTQGAA
ncbi:MAG: thiamine phosphate synthase [Cucumibacter sp.]